MALGDSTGGFSVSDFTGGASPLQLGALGIGAAGVGTMLAQGPGKLPPQFQQLETQVPGLTGTGESIVGQGQSLFGQGEEALALAQAGQLTAPQAAELQQYSQGLNNQTRQLFYNQGRNPDTDTAALTQTANNDAMINAMAQKEIQTTIQLGLGEITGGSSLMQTGLGFESAANNILLQAGEAQLKNDQSYSTNLMSAFGAIGKLFGGFGGSSSSGAGAGSSSVLADLGLAGEDPATVLESMALVA